MAGLSSKRRWFGGSRVRVWHTLLREDDFTQICPFLEDHTAAAFQVEKVRVLEKKVQMSGPQCPCLPPLPSTFFSDTARRRRVGAVVEVFYH